jgi:hypothetical protein
VPIETEFAALTYERGIEGAGTPVGTAGETEPPPVKYTVTKSPGWVGLPGEFTE